MQFLTYSLGEGLQWSLVALDRWSSYTVTIAWEMAWEDSALVVLNQWSLYRGGRFTKFDCKYTNTFSYIMLTRMKTKKKKRQKYRRSGHLPELLYSCNYHQA